MTGELGEIYQAADVSNGAETEARGIDTVVMRSRSVGYSTTAGNVMFQLPALWNAACFIATARLSCRLVSSITISARCFGWYSLM